MTDEQFERLMKMLDLVRQELGIWANLALGGTVPVSTRELLRQYDLQAAALLKEY